MFHCSSYHALRTDSLVLITLQDGEKGKQKDLVALNEASITTEIERLGAGLIKKIVVQVR